jgi:hypothetical protein
LNGENIRLIHLCVLQQQWLKAIGRHVIPLIHGYCDGLGQKNSVIPIYFVVEQLEPLAQAQL